MRCYFALLFLLAIPIVFKCYFALLFLLAIPMVFKCHFALLFLLAIPMVFNGSIDVSSINGGGKIDNARRNFFHFFGISNSIKANLIQVHYYIVQFSIG